MSDLVHDLVMGELGNRRAALAIVISGAPGSGKTTLARQLSEVMQLPHLNKDLVNASLMRAGVDRGEANTRAFRVVFGTAQSWMRQSVSLVMDMTMYPDYSPQEVATLQPLGGVVHVHCRADDAFERWSDKIRATRSSEDAKATIDRWPDIVDLVSDPLDLGCPRLDVDTTDGYTPTLERIVEQIEEVHDSQLGGGV